jgi:hypothetical protein
MRLLDMANQRLVPERATRFHVQAEERLIVVFHCERRSQIPPRGPS